MLWEIAFVVGGLFFLFAWLFGVKQMIGLISAVDKKPAEQRERMNLPALCRVLGIGFAVLGGVFALAGVLDMAGVREAVPYAFIVMFPVIWYMAIRTQKYDGTEVDNRPQKRRLRFTDIGASLLVIAIALFVCSLTYSALREPKVSLSDDEIEIGGLFGTSFSKAEIEEVSLIDEPQAFSGKDNGVELMGVYKGNFTHAELGPVLVYVKDDSAPWICLRRVGKPVLISLSNSAETMELYEKIASWMN